MCIKRYFIKVEGIVQGVGFRPFVYNLALKNSLTGWVNNNSQGVFIDLEGKDKNLSNFIYKLKNSPPPLSKIDHITKKEMELKNYKNFEILKSEENKNKITLISPDIATCKDCLDDIDDPKNRRHNYSFTNCTNCGPRFSIIKSIPYDRDKTTMKKFSMCTNCNKEYTDPTNRRFHAQPNACSLCGPHLFVLDSKKNIISDEDSISLDFTRKKLKDGYIFAIKGLGGFNLACTPYEFNVIEKLRTRKNRKDKPFAVMAKDIETAKKYCLISEKEESILTGIRKPIVILKRNIGYNLPENLAPNQNTLGVMLPYTPLHHLLFKDGINLLIMTSANLNSIPLEYENESCYANLHKIADYFLMHNRDIHVPIDDSVVRVIDNKIRLIRRARGYVPLPINEPNLNSILALGGNMKNTFAISKQDYIFLSQHNGNLENIETTNHYLNNIDHFKNIFLFQPDYVALDKHPLYESTKYGETLNIKKIKIQHHHAHIVSCLAENNINNKVIGICFDGTGYGDDHKIWGGEFLICHRSQYTRVSHLGYICLQGGDKAVQEPYRVAISYILNAYSQAESIEIIKRLYKEKGLIISNLIKSKINCIETSSMGRFFDAASSIIGIRNTISYEGQASIEMESIINNNIKSSYSYEIDENLIIITKETIKDLILDKLNNISKDIMATKFHNTIINITIDVAKRLRELYEINEIALSGGVFQNAYLLENLIHEFQALDFIVYTQSEIPSNDGGLSLGQLVAANEIIKNSMTT
ncbi:MAG: carbamoyltransferase HypF [Clostridiaceae bacterium]